MCNILEADVIPNVTLGLGENTVLTCAIPFPVSAQLLIHGHFIVTSGASGGQAIMRVRQGVPNTGPILYMETVTFPANTWLSVPFGTVDTSDWLRVGGGVYTLSIAATWVGSLIRGGLFQCSVLD